MLSIALQFGDEVGTHLFRFWVVGTFGYFIDLAITFGLFKLANVHKYISNSLGFISGLTFNFILNRSWTFHSTDPNITMQYIKFASIGVFGLGIVNGIVYYLHTKRDVPFVIAKTLAMFVFFFWNFTANYFYTFAK